MSATYGLIALFVISGVAMAGLFWLRRSHTQADRATVASVAESFHGFDLTECLVNRKTLVQTNIPRDGAPRLDFPAVWTHKDVEAFNANERGKYLVGSDRVAGLEIGGEARAYPIRVLNWHLIINDVVGGVPVAVSYSPLADALVAFERQVEGMGTLEFGASGLLFNSTDLFFNRPQTRGSDATVTETASLWCPLQQRAVAGPAAARGARLKPIPVALVTWKQWTALHPEGPVVAPDPALKKRYRKNPYGAYYTSGMLQFPVEPLPPVNLPKSAGLMDRVVVAGIGGQRSVFRIADLPVEPGLPSGSHARFAHGDFRMDWQEADPPVADVRMADGRLPDELYHACWFAWHAMHPEAKLSNGDFRAAP